MPNQVNLAGINQGDPAVMAGEEMSEKKHISDLTPDSRNANKGTLRGMKVLDTSLRERGAGRGILIDKFGRIIAGNKTVQAASDAGIDEIIVVPTDGRQLVATQRTDLDLEQDEAARLMAYEDNRVGQLDLDFDASVLAADIEAGLNLAGLFYEDELTEIISEAMLAGDLDKALGDKPNNERQLGNPAKQIKPVLYVGELATFEKALKATGNKNRGHAVIEICEFYLAKRQLDL